MTDAHELLTALWRAGVRLHVREDGALVLTPRCKLTEKLREAARRLKPQLVTLLSGNGSEPSEVAWVRELAALLTATAPPGGWHVAWRAVLRCGRPQLLRRIERAEQDCDAAIERLSVGETTPRPWAETLREYELALLDARAVLIERAVDAARMKAWA